MAHEPPRAHVPPGGDTPLGSPVASTKAFDQVPKAPSGAGPPRRREKTPRSSRPSLSVGQSAAPRLEDPSDNDGEHISSKRRLDTVQKGSFIRHCIATVFTYDTALQR